MAFLEKFWFFTNFIGLRPLADFEPLVVISDQKTSSQSKLTDTTTNTGNIDGGDIAPIPQPDKPDPVAGMEEVILRLFLNQTSLILSQAWKNCQRITVSSSFT